MEAAADDVGRSLRRAGVLVPSTKYVGTVSYVKNPKPEENNI